MTAIVCMDNNRAIGRQNRLLFRLSADLKHFKELTAGGHLLMGRNTFDSLPGPLPGRTHVVLSRDPEFAPPCARVLRSMEEAKVFIAHVPDIWLIGGAMMYEALLPLCDAAYVTKVDAEAPGADAFFPDIDAMPAWTCVEEGAWLQRDGLRFRFCRYGKAGDAEKSTQP